MINVDMKHLVAKRATRVRLDLNLKNGGLKLILSVVVLVVFAKLLINYIDAPDVPVCSNTADISVQVAGRQYYNTYYVNCVKEVPNGNIR